MTEPTVIQEAHHDLNHPASRKRALWAAFKAGDARFDGQAFVGVSSTGIYCRPVCHAHMPKYENCTFFETAAEAEAAGYRPCMVCRPELAPGMSVADATSNLAQRGAAYLRANCTSGESLERMAAKLGYTDRHLRRAFEDEFSVTPIHYLETCRLLLAKTLLTDSNLPVAQVAQASGFKSVRRFNDLFKKRYRMPPTKLRKNARAAQEAAAEGAITFRLGYRPPYRFDDLLAFFRDRALEGVEVVDDKSYARTVRLELPEGVVAGWIRVENNARASAVTLTMSESLLPATSQVVSRVRRLFDIDCNPAAVYEKTRTLDKMVPGPSVLGTRVPGCFDAFEIASRAVLGQQVTIAAANKIAARIVERYGAPVQTGIPGLERAFPTAADVCALPDIEEAFGVLGVIKTRSRTIAEIARQLESGELMLEPGAVVSQQMEQLLAIKGIGPWSANYIAMRTLNYPDAFLETDAGVKHALPDTTPAERRALAEQWRPWRSYANVALWNGLAFQKEEQR